MRRGHPVFARFYVRVGLAMERGGVNAHRTALLAGTRGRVIEIGAGSGLNFPHYPAGVDQVVAVEPEPRLRALATDAARTAPVPITVTDGVAEDLPAEDGSFDTAVACLMLCSVDHRETALAELFRVLKPGGRLHVFEHVQAATPGLAGAQRVLDATIWPVVNGGCHLGADTRTAIDRAGFTGAEFRDVMWPQARIPLPFAPHILGTAVRPAAAETTGTAAPAR